MKTLYQCNECGRIIIQESDKKRIKSNCTETNKIAYLIRIDNKEKLIEKMRKKHLSALVDLSSFKKKDAMFIEMAFEQGATVMFNAFKIN